MYSLERTETTKPNKYLVKNMIEIIICFSFISSLFLPPFKVSSSLSLRLDDFLLLLISPLILLPTITLIKSKSLINGYLAVYILVVCCMIFSTVRGYYVLDVPYSSGDINEIIRFLKPVFIISLVAFTDPASLKERISKIMYYGSIYIVFLGIVQYFNPIGFGQLLGGIYGEVHHLQEMVGSDLSNRRVILSGGGPNDGALIALFLMIFMIFSFFEEKKKIYPILAICLFFCIILTSSRTTLLAAFLVGMFLLLQYGTFITKVIFIVLACCIIIYVFPYFHYIYVGFEMAMAGTNTSLLKRFVKWDDAYQLFLQSKLFGWGIAKSIHITIVDGEYFLMLRRFGLVGSVFMMIFLLFPFLIKIKIKTIFYNTVKYIAIASIVIMVTNNFINSYQIITAYTILVSIVICNKTKQKISLY